MTTRGTGRTRVRHGLIAIEALTGASAALGGSLLIARPDGHLIGARTTALAGSPFGSWLMPGILLVAFVGGGYLTAAVCLAADAAFAQALSVVAGLGLIVFEVCEVAWLGFQPLEAAFMAVGMSVAALGLTLSDRPRT